MTLYQQMDIERRYTRTARKFCRRWNTDRATFDMMVLNKLLTDMARADMVNTTKVVQDKVARLRLSKAGFKERDIDRMNPFDLDAMNALKAALLQMRKDEDEAEG